MMAYSVGARIGHSVIKIAAGIPATLYALRPANDGYQYVITTAILILHLLVIFITRKQV